MGRKPDRFGRGDCGNSDAAEREQQQDGSHKGNTLQGNMRRHAERAVRLLAGRAVHVHSLGRQKHHQHAAQRKYQYPAELREAHHAERLQVIIENRIALSMLARVANL